MTSSDPDVIRRQIEDTRANLSYEVDALNEKVNPTRVVDRRVGKAKSSVAGLMVAVFLSCALWWALENVMDAGLAALIVAVIWIVIAAVLASMGRKQLKTIDFSGLKNINPKPEQTVETLQQVPGALKPN